MGNKGTLDSRLKKIRKELSLIDDDLKSLSRAAVSTPGSAVPRPKLKSRQLIEEGADSRPRTAGAAAGGAGNGVVLNRRPPEKADSLKQDGKPAPGGDERFLEYLSTSFNSGLPLRQERKLQRNKAIVMLIVVLFFLFLILYRMLM